MVCFTYHPNSTAISSLTTAWSVFLPVGTPDVRQSDVRLQVSLSLHGYFFVNTGRSHIDFPEGSQGPGGEAFLRRRWNGTLRDEVLLPQLLPALAFFVESAGLTEEQTTALTKLLIQSPVGHSQDRPHVCKNHQWIFQINADGSGWSLIDTGPQILEIPDGSAELFTSVFPELTNQSSDYCFTPSGFPRILNSNSFAWPELLLARFLDVPAGVFENEDTSQYLLQFLEARKNDVNRFQSSQDALVQTVRRVGQLASLTALHENRETTSKILSYIPRDR